jgi:two-component system OmpR family response regulator
MSTLRKILHVDDEDDIRELVELSLGMIGGFEMFQANCGEQALAIVEETKPDLLLLDVMMPGLSGPETLEKISEMAELHNVPGIFMSAKGRDFIVPHAVENKTLAVIPKPFDPSSLPMEIEALWNQWAQSS